MENLDGIMEWIMANVPVAGYIIMALGALVVLGQMYIAITPTQKDDIWYASLEEKPVIGWILKQLAKFAPIGRKELPKKVAKKK